MGFVVVFCGGWGVFLYIICPGFFLLFLAKVFFCFVLFFISLTMVPTITPRLVVLAQGE